MNNESMHKIFLILGTVLGGLAVALGAFGAHGLKKLVAPETIATYQTGVHYQMYHALALMFLGGVVFFSGSLYLIVSMQAMNKAIPTYIGIITPAGGLLFIIGWILLLL